MPRSTPTKHKSLQRQQKPKPPHVDTVETMTMSDHSVITRKSGATTTTTNNTTPSSRRSFYSKTSAVNAVNNNDIQHYRECGHNDNNNEHYNNNEQCYCIKEFYEEDEVCRRDYSGRLEFGIVSRYESHGRDNLKIFWTLSGEIEEQDLDLDNVRAYRDVILILSSIKLRLVDRKALPGDIVFMNKRRGEVIDVSWSSYVRILENGMTLLDIPCERLEPLIPHYPGQRLELDGWIGTVTSVWTEATLMFSKGKTVTGVVECSGLPHDKQPYPGRKVRYTYDQYMNAGLKLVDGNQMDELFHGEDDILEAFVLFLHVSEIQVKWNGKVAPTSDSSTEMPATSLSRGQLKKRKVRVLGTPADTDWECSPDAVDRFYQYSVHPDDLIIIDIREDMIEKYMAKKNFDYEAEIRRPSKTMVRKLGDEYKVMKNVNYAVRVLRFGRVLHVKWFSTGKVDKIPANRVTLKHSLRRPFHQFVQKKISLAPYTHDEYGMILSYDTNDTVQIQWFSRKPSDPPNDFKESAILTESVYDLEPHFAYGALTPKQLVYRSVNCRQPEALFTVGWVRSVTLLGEVVVVSMHSKQEHVVYPSEIQLTGMKIHNEESPNPKREMKSLVELHGLRTLKMSDEMFLKNLQTQMDWAGKVIPDTEHFVPLSKAPPSHSFYSNKFEVKSGGRWMRAVKKDQLFLTTRVNEDIGTIWIKGFRDRLDLFSVLMAAPPGTPYEGGLYNLDVQLTGEYPSSPPALYLTTIVSSGTCTGNDCSGILRPGIHNLELGDNVMPPHTLVESLIAIQCKLFSPHPLDSLTPPSSAGSFQRREFLMKESEERLTNAQILIDVLDLIFRMAMDPPKLWTVETINYFHMTFEKTKKRLLSLIRLTHTYAAGSHEDWLRPTFPMIPLTDGFTNAVVGRIRRFEELMGLLQG